MINNKNKCVPIGQLTGTAVNPPTNTSTSNTTDPNKCEEGLDCNINYGIVFPGEETWGAPQLKYSEWRDVYGFHQCNGINRAGNYAGIMCCEKGQHRVWDSNHTEPGVCACPPGQRRGHFIGSTDLGFCITYQPVVDSQNHCLPQLACMERMMGTEPPRGSTSCQDKDGTSKYCCQPGDTRIRSDFGPKLLCQ
jgi:hypothetical protein